MPLPDIQLDDRKFEDIFQEARRRIPAYTPEWTDHNESDPGITMLQLFAWLQEMILYRLNQVPQKNYIKFLELVGLPLIPPAPATAELTFTLAQNAPATLVPPGTQVSLSSGGDGLPVIFETDDNLLAVSLKLVSIQSFDGSLFSSFTDADQTAGQSFMALSASPGAGTALYLGFDQVFPKGSHRITVHVGATGVVSPVAGGSSAAQAAAPPVQSTWEYYAGEKAGWRALSVTSDTTASLTLSGTVIVDAPPDAVLAKMGLLKKPSDPALFWMRFRILLLNGSGYETPPLIQNILLNTITATNSVTESYELLGAANGRPNQTVQLARFPVLPLPSGNAGFIDVDEGDGNGYLPWVQVEDFGGSGREDKVYTLNLSTGLVTFGDGVNGKIPRWLSGNGSNRDDADIPNIRATQYRWGGGARGNAGALQITSLLSSVPYVASVTNLLPSIGGADEESLAQAQERAPMALRTAQRAVTVEDFSFLAIETPGAQIRRAQAFPLLNPMFRFTRPAIGQAAAEVPIPGTITVIVVPDSTDPKPTPSAGTLKLVARWLDGHRLLTTELFVAPPRYRQVSIEAQVIADTNFNNGQVQATLEDKLKAYFHPLTGGIAGSGWDFGGTIYFSETYRQILDTQGVLRIEPGTLKTFVDGVQQDSCSDINLEADELVYSTGHTVLVSYS